MFSTNVTIQNMARMIDLSCVKADNTLEELDEMVAFARKYRVVCCFAMPYYTPWLIEQLKNDPDIHVGAAIGFPSGADLTETKVATARTFKELGCNELDMVINLTALKAGRTAVVEDEIRRIIEVGDGLPVKSIIEVSCLTSDEIKRASECVARAGADYVKTGTGWGKQPTTVEHIRLIHSVVGDLCKIKAAGGVRDLNTILEMIDAGCSRFGIGTKSAAHVFEEIEEYEKLHK